jgi:hypoxanthine phosphoribosyltransferase
MAGTRGGNTPGFRVLLGKRRIRERVRSLARRIGKDYRGTVPVFVGILNGSFVFLADLIRELEIECEIEFVRLSSYRGKRTNPGRIRLRQSIGVSLAGRRVIVVEDVIDSGRSIAFVRKMIRRHRPHSVRVATLLLKEDHSSGEKPEYVGFTIPPVFVAGYGLDYDGKLRNRRSIYRLTRPN